MFHSSQSLSYVLGLGLINGAGRKEPLWCSSWLSPSSSSMEPSSIRAEGKGAGELMLSAFGSQSKLPNSNRNELRLPTRVPGSIHCLGGKNNGSTRPEHLLWLIPGRQHVWVRDSVVTVPHLMVWRRVTVYTSQGLRMGTVVSWSEVSLAKTLP